MSLVINRQYIKSFLIITLLCIIFCVIIDIQKKSNVTIVTLEEPSYSKKKITTIYLNKLKKDVEYLAKNVDVKRCETIKDKLDEATKSLEKQIILASEQNNLNLTDFTIKTRINIKRRLNIMHEILFKRETPESNDDIQDILLELILNLETLIYITDIVDINQIDVGVVDSLVKIIYEYACVKNNDLQPVRSNINVLFNKQLINEKPRIKIELTSDPKKSFIKSARLTSQIDRENSELGDIFRFNPACGFKHLKKKMISIANRQKQSIKDSVNEKIQPIFPKKNFKSTMMKLNDR